MYTHEAGTVKPCRLCIASAGFGERRADDVECCGCGEDRLRCRDGRAITGKPVGCDKYVVRSVGSRPMCSPWPKTKLAGVEAKNMPTRARSEILEHADEWEAEVLAEHVPGTQG